MVAAVRSLSHSGSNVPGRIAEAVSGEVQAAAGQVVTLWWASWECPTEDTTPLRSPPPFVMGFWEAGHPSELPILLAVVEGRSARRAVDHIRFSWPFARMRFCEPWGGRLDSRFSWPDWSPIREG